jgi:hypothetical protein
MAENLAPFLDKMVRLTPNKTPRKLGKQEMALNFFLLQLSQKLN